jgi:guanylate kinase
MTTRPFPIVLSAPSGSGKTTICREILRTHAEITLSVSATTRPRRPEELDGQDYLFVSPERFSEMVRREELAEWASVHGHFYGTPRSRLEACLRGGMWVLLDIDIQGGLRVKELYPESVLVFVLPPTLDELAARLQRRGTESDDVRRTRLTNALKEIEALVRYDYLVINDLVPRAVADVEAIIAAERLRPSRLEGLREEWGIEAVCPAPKD